MSNGRLDSCRDELQARQSFVASLLSQVGADQLLMFDPANVHWFAGAPLARSILNPTQQPALIVTAKQRWLVCSDLDSQRLFDEFLDGLGFQLKQWPWHGDRDDYVAGLCEKKKLACDRLIRDAICVVQQLKDCRLIHHGEASEALRSLGRDVAHALDATARSIEASAIEAEVAGQIAHRLVHHGIEPVAIHVAADGRDGPHLRMPFFGDRAGRYHFLLSTTARRDGLYVSASRVVVFGEMPRPFQQDCEVASQCCAARIGAIKPGVPAADVFQAGQRVAAAMGHEFAWRESQFAHLSGYLPIERELNPCDDVSPKVGHCIVLKSRVGAANVMDTYLVTDDGCELITRDADSPMRRFQLADRIIEVPDVLRR